MPYRRDEAVEAKRKALLAKFKADMDTPPPVPIATTPITPEQRQMLDDWQAGHDEDYPEVFSAEERARAKAYAHEHSLSLTLEYIARLERIALASMALLKFDMLYLMRNPSEGEKQKELYEALRAVKLFEDGGL